MNTPTLRTKRLLLRKFTENDLDALYQIFRDAAVNTFLPWFPLSAASDARAFYEEHFASKYRQPSSYHYAVCRKEDNIPIGYVTAETGGCHDFGYGLRKEFWHRGIITEAGRAVIEQLAKDGVAYITATHDVRNPRSGEVMKRLGMTYQYSYVEQWQPKDFPVVFRMYQRSLCERGQGTCQEYWNRSAVHFVETGV